MVGMFEARYAASGTATSAGLTAVRAAPFPALHQSRPGRPVVVLASLAALRGPTTGTVELPIWLFWHPDRRFDLDEPGLLAWMYQIVLREARDPGDLAYLNGERLIAIWPDLYLPGGVRQAWEDQHPELHPAPVPARA
jgi:hypothetical protein